jgi:hypothetical protein
VPTWAGVAAPQTYRYWSGVSHIQHVVEPSHGPMLCDDAHSRVPIRDRRRRASLLEKPG